MIKADAKVAELCNREMRKESEKRAGWNLENNEYTKCNIYTPYDSLFCKVYFALPESQRRALINVQPLPPKKWNDCEWGLFYRGLVHDKLNPFFSGSPLTGNFTPDKDALRNGLYCPLRSNGEFDLRYGCIKIYMDDESDVEIVSYYQSLEKGLRRCNDDGLLCDLYDEYTWVLRCDEDVFLVTDKKPSQCEVPGHGLCYMAEMENKTDTYNVYWKVLDDENAATICDWQHPFKVVKEPGLHEYVFTMKKHIDDKEIALSDTVFFYLLAKQRTYEREIERAIKMRQWFI